MLGAAFASVINYPTEVLPQMSPYVPKSAFVARVNLTSHEMASLPVVKGQGQ